MRRFLSAGALCVPLFLIFCSAAYATFSGVNGRIVYTVPDYFPVSDFTVKSVCADGSNSIPIATNATWGSPSPDGTKVAYSAPADGSAPVNIWVSNADGSNPQKITNDAYTNEWPTWSPDGTKLTYHRGVPNDEVPTGFVGSEMPYIVDLAAKLPTRLTTTVDIRLPHGAGPNRWSPDGQRIYFEGTAKNNGDITDQDIYWAPAGANGSATRIIGTGGMPWSRFIDVSPDGTKMIVVRDNPGPAYDIDPEMTNWIYTFGGGTVKLSDGILNETGESGDELPAFSPDGTKVVYSHLGFPPQKSVEQLAYSDLDGGNEHKVGSGIWGAFPQWSTNNDGCVPLGGGAGMRVNEVSLASTGSTAAQFVELIDTSDESFPTDAGPYKLTVYDSSGAKTDTHTISNTLLQNRDNTQPLLISTVAANAAYSVTGDEPLSVPLPNPGQACFTNGSSETKVSCVTWGCVANPVTPTIKVSAPAAGSSVQRQGAGSTTFHSGTPTPKAANVAGAASTACVPPPSGGDGDGGGGGNGGGSGQPADTAPPQTSGKTTKKLKLAKRAKSVSAKFTFASSEAGSAFNCKLDKGAFKPCKSPYKLKLKKGKHTLQVVAVDAAGNADASPVALTVTVKA